MPQLVVKEKELTRVRDALAAERRRMPWLAVDYGKAEGLSEESRSEIDRGLQKEG